MRKLIILLWILLLQTACETGTKYDTNSSIIEDNNSGIVDMIHDVEEEADPTNSNSYYIDQGEDDYAKEITLANKRPKEVKEREVLEESITQSIQRFTGGTITDGLDIKKIRTANHDTYMRLVFDSDAVKDGLSSSPDKVGSYEVEYDLNAQEITVVLSGYRKFSAKLPAFSQSSTVEKIYFSKYLDDSGYKFHIKLRHPATIAVFALESPARLVFDVKAI